MRFLLTLTTLILCLSCSVYAQTSDAERAQALFASIRCASCQTQTIEFSNAQVAQDMRAFILAQIKQGASDDTIRDALRHAYGDGIFLSPPVQGNTYLLWSMPLIIFIIGFFLIKPLYAKREKQ